MTVVYIDSLALLNFSVNYLILLATARLTGAIFKRRRLCLGAALGALYAVLCQLFLFPGLWPFRIGMGFAICFAALGKNQLLKRSILFLGTAFAFGGGVWAIWLMAGGSGSFRDYVNPNMGAVILCAGVCYAVLDLGFRMTARHTGNSMAKTWIRRCKNQIALTAFRDSGNDLKDSANNQPVLLTELDYIKSLFNSEELEIIDPSDPVGSLERLAKIGVKARLIPYKAVGTRLGLLLAVSSELLAVDDRVYKNALIALSPTPISDTGTYTAIIGHDA